MSLWRLRRRAFLLLVVLLGVTADGLPVLPSTGVAAHAGAPSELPPLESPAREWDPTPAVPDSVVVPLPKGADPFAVDDFDEPAVPEAEVVEDPDPVGAPPPEYQGFVEGVSVELPELRTRFSQTYRNGDGTYTMRSSPTPVNYLDGDGAWQPIDNTLVPVAGVPLSVRNTANHWRVRFAPLPSGVKISADGESLQMSPVGTLPVAPKVESDGVSVVYENAWSNTDLRYTVMNDQVKEDIVIKGPPDRNVFEFSTGGVTMLPHPSIEGALVPAGPLGERSFLAPPVVFDHEGREIEAAAPNQSFSGSGSSAAVTVSLDADWLDSLDAADFPIVVDPPWYWDTGTDDNWAYKSDGSMCQHCGIRVGNSRSSGTDTYWRSVVHFPYGQSFLFGSHIVDARVRFWGLGSGTANSYPMHLYAATSWSYGGMGTKLAYVSSVSTEVNFTGSGLRNKVQDWVDDGASTGSFMVRGHDLGGTYTYKRFTNIWMYITYNRYPNTPTLSSPSNGANVHDITPTLSFNGSDPDGDSLTFGVWVCTNSGMSSGCFSRSYSSSKSWTIPSGKLTWNTTYYWRVRSYDGLDYSKSYSSVRSFKPLNRAPTVSLGGPANGSNVHDLTPTLNPNASDADGDTIWYWYTVCTNSAMTSCVYDHTSWVSGQDSFTVPSGKLAWNTTYYWRVKVWDKIAGSVNSSVWSLHTLNSAPPPPTPLSPADDGLVTELQPALASSTVTDPDGDPNVSYQFQVATGPNPDTGRIAESSWSTTPGWTPPAGTFADGSVYSWRVRARDQYGQTGSWSAVRTFRYDMRLGRHPNLPYDDLGPAGVNLATGNLVIDSPGPAFPSLGGSAGVSFSYNSHSPVDHGLEGEYWQDADRDGVVGPDDPFLLSRVDPVLNFNWGAAGPSPELDPEYWVARWTGSIKVPQGQAGQWKFVSDTTDDSVTVTVDGDVVLPATACCGTVVGSPVTLSDTNPLPIQVDYVQRAGGSKLRLKLEDPAGVRTDIPSDWLLPEQPSLPDGWSRTGDSMGVAAYTHIRPANGITTAVVDASGADHLYEWNGSVWQPPAGEDTELTQRADGTWSLRDVDGAVYRFGVDGRLIDFTSPMDDGTRQAPVYTYAPLGEGGPTRLTKVTDVSGRDIDLVYGPSQSCPQVAGFDPEAPSGMLCRIVYAGYGGGSTDLSYFNGHLARITDPGGETTDFAYDAQGRLVGVRDALTNDLIAGGVIPLEDASSPRHQTLVAYDTAGRVASVTSPVASASMAEEERPKRTYDYSATQAKVFVEGLLEPGRPARVVTFDAEGRVLTDTDPAGLVATNQWDTANEQVVATTAGDLKTTFFYDDAGSLIDTYGPAAPLEFDAEGRSTTAPRSTSGYDEGYAGLAATWYANSRLLGEPALHTIETLHTDWGAGSPGPGLPADGFSGTLSGEIEVTTEGDHEFDVAHGSLALVTVDGEEVVSRWDTYRESVLWDEPLAYWRLGDGAGTSAADSSAAGSNGGVTTGSVTFGADGGLDADGDTAATLAGAGRVDGPWSRPADDFAVEAWVQPAGTHEIDTESTTGTAGLVGQHYLFTPEDPGSDGAGLAVSVGTNGVSIYERSAAAMPATLVWPSPEDGPVDLSGWHHVVVNVHGGVPVLFVDGEEVRAAEASTGLALSAPRSIGGIVGGEFDGDVDEVAFYSAPLSVEAVSEHHAAGQPTFSGTAGGLTAGKHWISVDFRDLVGDASLSVSWTPPGGESELVPAGALSPGFGLETSTTDADGERAATEYEQPQYGLPTASVVDPEGLALRSTTAYENTASGGFFRPVARKLPAGAASQVTYEYYGVSEAPADQAGSCPGTAGVNQAGALKRTSAADPDGAGPQEAVVREYRYDTAGRIAASQVVGDADWSCTSYDARGRVTSVTDRLGNTTTTTYTPVFTTTVGPDSSGEVRTMVAEFDWIGRVISYTDEHGTVSETDYDQAGRESATWRTFAGGPRRQVTSSAYDLVTGRLISLTEYVSGEARTTSYTYDSQGRLATEALPNGVTTTNTYSADRGSLTQIEHANGSGAFSTWQYTYTAGGRVSGDTGGGRLRGYTYDTAGRLVQTVEGSTVRDYAFDANTNRCANAPTCADPTFVYDAADRLVESPYATDYMYDSHGNLVSAEPRAANPPAPLDRAFSFDRVDGPQSFPLVIGQAGDVSLDLAWGAMPVYRSDGVSAPLEAGASHEQVVRVEGPTTVRAGYTWDEGVREVESSFSGSLSAGGLRSHLVSPEAAGPLSVSVDWQATSLTPAPISDSVDNLAQKEFPVPVSGNGTVSGSLSWSSSLVNLDLYLVDPNGNVVDASESLTGTSASVSASVSGVSYPQSRQYKLRVKAVASGSSFTLSRSYPVTANVDVEVWSGGVKVAESMSTSAKPETLTYAAPGGGDYTVKVISKDHPAAYTLDTGYPVFEHAPVGLTLHAPDGSPVAAVAGDEGALALTEVVDGPGDYTVEVVNTSADVSAPGGAFEWSATTAGSGSWSTSLAAGGSDSRLFTAEGQGSVLSTVTWDEGEREVGSSFSGSLSAGGSRSHVVSPEAAGPLSVSVDWQAASVTPAAISDSVANLAEKEFPVEVSGNGTVSGSLSWSSSLVNLDLYLVDPSGAVVDSSESLTGTSESVSASVSGVAYPQVREYRLRVKAVASGSSFTLSRSYPVTANVDVEVWSGAQKVAGSVSTTAKPEALTYAAPAGGDYTVKVVSKDHPAVYALDVGYRVLEYAPLTVALKDASGVVLDEVSDDDGSVTLGEAVPAAGEYTLEITNDSSGVAAPGVEALTRFPQVRHGEIEVALLDGDGDTLAVSELTAPGALEASVVDEEVHQVRITPRLGFGAGTITGSYPGMPARERITYDAWDHAVRIDDGTLLVDEALMPDGRVVRRRVAHRVTGDVSEDVIYGYDGPGDSPAYIMPTGGGTVTTYVAGAVYTGTVVQYPVVNGHGDVVGHTDESGTFTPVPLTDEYGVGDPTPGRLGWLGDHQRYQTGGSLALIRMGVRLYDPTLGRFLSVDPIEGGNANDYIYPGDPTNLYDTSGNGWEASYRPYGCAGQIDNPHGSRHYRYRIATAARVTCPKGVRVLVKISIRVYVRRSGQYRLVANPDSYQRVNYQRNVLVAGFRCSARRHYELLIEARLTVSNQYDRRGAWHAQVRWRTSARCWNNRWR